MASILLLKWIVVDFETRSRCDLKRAGAWRYAEDLSTEVLCLSWVKSDGQSGVWFPGDPYPFAGDEAVPFIAHNVGFEKAIWRFIMAPMFGWPDIPNARWHDTMATCAMRSIPQGLDDAARVLRLHNQKDTEGRKITLGLSKVDKHGNLPTIDADILRRVGEYCLADSRSEAGCYKLLGSLPRPEWVAWHLDQRINERGISVDLEFVESARKVAKDAMRPLAAEFADITGGLRVGQRDQFLQWLHINGLVLPNLQKETLAPYMREIERDLLREVRTEWFSATGEEDDDDLPGPVPTGTSDLTPSVRRALALRRLSDHSSLKKLDRLVDCVASDGRVHGCLNWHAAGPGRWGGRLFQPQNFPRGTIDKRTWNPDTVVQAIKTGDHEYVRLIGEPIEVVVSSLRHALVPGRGRIFLSGDYAGIQARTVLAIAGQHDKTALMASGADVYCDMATQIYNHPVNAKEHPEKRQTGKNSVLGLGFQMGAPKFKYKYAQEQTEEFCQHVVRVYRKEWAPRVPYLWYGLQNAAVRTVWDGTPHESHGVVYRLVDGWLTATVPTGGVIWYYNPRPIRTLKPWEVEEWEDPYQDAIAVSGEKNGHWSADIHIFGGMLTQNVVTRIEVDMINRAGVLCEQNGMPIVLTVHDELVAEPLAVDADEKAFKQIMLDVHQSVNAIGIPVSVETWAGDRYRK